MTTTMIFHSSELYYSIARRCWRIEVWETGGTWQQNRTGYIHAERKADADRIADRMKDVANFSDFDLLISDIKEKMDSKTGWVDCVSH